MTIKTDKCELLLRRLGEITELMQSSDNCLALIGLGSSGVAINRMDEYSDLDLFMIVKEGSKRHYLDSLDWLSSISSLAYVFRNSVDGYKVLFQDGVFCEFAVFEAAEFAGIPFSDARVIWAIDSFDRNIPIANKLPPLHDHPIEWYVNEALTNVYVGLLRHQRGEVLNAYRFIQGYAVDRLVELANSLDSEKHIGADPFSKTRRFEKRFPEMSPLLSDFIQGYSGNVESALAILDFLDTNYEVSKSLREAIIKAANTVGDQQPPTS